jgi:hypothetical protein
MYRENSITGKHRATHSNSGTNVIGKRRVTHTVTATVASQGNIGPHTVTARVTSQRQTQGHTEKCITETTEIEKIAQRVRLKQDLVDAITTKWI